MGSSPFTTFHNYQLCSGVLDQQQTTLSYGAGGGGVGYVIYHMKNLNAKPFAGKSRLKVAKVTSCSEDGS